MSALPMLSLAPILLLMTASIKSICIYSFLWLPDAMEGPTPVSSLLHSATLVLTGLLLYVLLADSTSSPDWFSLLLMSGSLVIPISCSFDPDAKKLAALSTCLMISFLYLSVFVASHHAMLLISMCHASYKSTVFVCLALFTLTYCSQDVRSSSLTSVSSLSFTVMPLLLIYSLALPGTLYALVKVSLKLSVSYIDALSLRSLIDWAIFLNPCWLSFLLPVFDSQSGSSVAVSYFNSSVWSTLAFVSFLPTSSSNLFGSVSSHLLLELPSVSLWAFSFTFLRSLYPLIATVRPSDQSQLRCLTYSYLFSIMYILPRVAHSRTSYRVLIPFLIYFTV
jgi:hypothetical protein